ncbi:MAG: SGNH/GDSL hydrolase family protein [Armatimonadetes bacterium]|nr:SGNH/GDSL hydrolase family protein [Armatimonadota bacterium]
MKRRLVLVSAGLTLIYVVLFYYHLRVRRPVGSGPAGQSVRREAFRRHWTDRPVLLLALGDSVTAGFGASPGHSYVERIVSNPRDEFPDMRGLCLTAVLPHLLARNLAVSGSTSIDHLDRQISRIEKQTAAVLGLVVITTGGNDVIHDYGRTPPREGAMYGATLSQARPWIDRFEKRLETMIDHIEGSFPGGCQIFVANVYDPTDGIGDMEEAGLPEWRDGLRVLAAYNKVIADCAAERASVHLVNIHDAFLGHGIHCTQFWRRYYDRNDPHYWYYENLEDPNDRGYDAMRRLFLIEIAKVFAE